MNQGVLERLTSCGVIGHEDRMDWSETGKLELLDGGLIVHTKIHNALY